MSLKRDFSAPILDLDDKPVRAGLSVQALTAALDKVWPDLSQPQRDKITSAIDEAAGKPLTLGISCVQALMAPYRDEENLSGEERLKRITMARKINRGGVARISVEERDMVKPLLRKAFAGPLVSTVASELLETELSEDAATPVN